VPAIEPTSYSNTPTLGRLSLSRKVSCGIKVVKIDYTDYTYPACISYTENLLELLDAARHTQPIEHAYNLSGMHTNLAGMHTTPRARTHPIRLSFDKPPDMRFGSVKEKSDESRLLSSKSFLC